MVNTNDTPNRFFTAVRHRLYPFFWFIASSNEKILRQSPTQEQDKHFGYGMAILLTSMAAVVSGYFAFSLMLQNDTGQTRVVPALLVALLWGFLILNLDRIMVGSMKKDIENRRSKELLPVLPRIVLATVIAVVISKPIEVELLKSQIEADQAKNRQMEVYNSTVVTNNTIEKIEGAQAKNEQKLAEYQNQTSTIEQEPGYSAMKLNLDACTTKSAQLDTKIAANNREIRSLWGNDQYSSLEEVPTGDSLGSTKMERTLNQRGKDVRYRLNKEISAYNVEKRNLGCAAIQTRMDNYRQQRTTELDSASAKESQELIANEATLKDEEAKRKKLQGTNDTLFTNADKNFFGLLDDLGTLKSRNSNILWASWLLVILFFILEIAPIFVKWICDRGIYDELLEEDEESTRNEIKIRAKENKIHLESTIANGQAYLTADSAANEQLLEKIMSAQSTIGQKIVEEWQKSELKKLDNDPDDYLNNHIIKS